MSEADIADYDEEEGEAEPEGLVTKNPIGEYYGARNDKNERHGRGRAVLPSGDIYLGCYYRGQRHGLGVYRYKNGNGARYGGDWVFGEKQGWGTFYYPDGSQYTGNWDRGIKHGWGVYVYPNGDEYEGWWYRGKRNGRGIYRTKKTNEKFVGHWILGQRQGAGMLIRKYHRYIGNWYNDVPKGPGVYIFPKLHVEQHGKYTLVKIPPGAEERWKNQGYQIRQIRSAPPPRDPVDVENERNAFGLDVASEDYGEDFGENAKTLFKNRKLQGGDGPSEQLPGQMANPKDVIDYMRTLIESAAEADEDKIPVVPVWRAIQITGLMTEVPDDTVPPPPMPATPQPPAETLEDADLGSGGDKTAGEEEDPIAVARNLAKTHKLGPTYLGQGVCQLSEQDIHFPEDKIEHNFSLMSLSNMDEFRMQVQAMSGQMEPLDVKTLMAANAHLFKQGMEVAEQWRPCLANDANCKNPQVPIPSGQHAIDEKVAHPQTPQQFIPPADQAAPLDQQFNPESMQPQMPGTEHILPQHGNVPNGMVPEPVHQDHTLAANRPAHVDQAHHLQPQTMGAHQPPQPGQFNPPEHNEHGFDEEHHEMYTGTSPHVAHPQPHGVLTGTNDVPPVPGALTGTTPNDLPGGEDGANPKRTSIPGAPRKPS